MTPDPTGSAAMSAAYIVGRLTASPTVMAACTGVFRHPAPKGTVCPYLTYTGLSSSDLQGIGTIRVLTNREYAVRGVTDTGSITGLDGLLAAVDAALTGPQVYARGKVLSCVRQGQDEQSDTDQGVIFSSLINRYLIQTTEDQEG